MLPSSPTLLSSSSFFKAHICMHMHGCVHTCLHRGHTHTLSLSLSLCKYLQLQPLFLFWSSALKTGTPMYVYTHMPACERTHTHARTRARAHTHTHTHERTHTHTHCPLLCPSFLFSNLFIYVSSPNASSQSLHGGRGDGQERYTAAVNQSTSFLAAEG